MRRPAPPRTATEAAAVADPRRGGGGRRRPWRRLRAPRRRRRRRHCAGAPDALGTAAARASRRRSRRPRGAAARGTCDTIGRWSWRRCRGPGSRRGAAARRCRRGWWRRRRSAAAAASAAVDPTVPPTARAACRAREAAGWAARSPHRRAGSTCLRLCESGRTVPRGALVSGRHAGSVEPLGKCLSSETLFLSFSRRRVERTTKGRQEARYIPERRTSNARASSSLRSCGSGAIGRIGPGDGRPRTSTDAL